MRCHKGCLMIAGGCGQLTSLRDRVVVVSSPSAPTATPSIVTVSTQTRYPRRPGQAINPNTFTGFAPIIVVDSMEQTSLREGAEVVSYPLRCPIPR